MPNPNPVTAWKALKEGNERFAAGKPEHPHQGGDRRAELTKGQHPIAALLSCSDSRIATEIVFDQGLGDVFVVRNAGHVLDAAVLGSLEYAVAVLNVPLVVVVGHTSCGAVQATAATVNGEPAPSGHIRDVVALLTPSVRAARSAGFTTVDEFVVQHAKETVAQLRIRSSVVAQGIAAGSLAVVGATYSLADGHVVLREHLGDIGES
ncbi:carbonic anhydrase [Mycobacterium sp. 1274761.0]|uniref:carbonic anhydrase n=1 Tax=Mycobacterium sp. 1274761.0 TaxID=1834077 RepID=UPI0007FC3556|nr:carbonic anhydrase [Mycobacterium sp. 1274761.0]OBK79034.1 carbonic anhydrase [Mycobacterium sp. 1274761.0]